MPQTITFSDLYEAVEEAEDAPFGANPSAISLECAKVRALISIAENLATLVAQSGNVQEVRIINEQPIPVEAALGGISEVMITNDPLRVRD